MENQSSYSPLAKVIATVVIITFTMLLLKPTAIAAQVLYGEYEQASAKAARAEAIKLSKTLQTVETTLTALQNTLSTESPETMLSKPQDNALADNRSVALDLAQVQKNLKGLKQQLLKLDQYTQHRHNLSFFEFMFVPHNFWNSSIVNETTKTQFVMVLSIVRLSQETKREYQQSTVCPNLTVRANQS
jgi:hypothetical protein